MRRRVLTVWLASALLLAGGIAGSPPINRTALAAAPQKEGGADEEKKAEENLSPEQKMARRFPQPVKVGDLVGLPVLDWRDSTIGFIREVVRSPAGKIQLIVPYGHWFGWLRMGERFRRPVAVPIETVAILGRQVAAVDMPREEFDKAPSFIASQATPISRDEINFDSPYAAMNMKVTPQNQFVSIGEPQGTDAYPRALSLSMDDQTPHRLKARTLSAQALNAGDAATHALVPPIHMSATYLRDADNGYSSGFVYGRSDNVSVKQTEALISALEGAESCMLFSSGMAAATAVFLALEKPTHIIASRVMYWGFRSWLGNIGRYGHSVTFVETSDLDAVRAAVKPGQTGIFWIETPSNPLWTITDIAAISEIAHDVGAILCVDSTISTPVFTQPIALGADIVMHSATKYLNGHSDVVAGALATACRNPFWSKIQEVRSQVGASLGPFESWLVMRGMRTLHVRVKEQAKTAAVLADRLIDNPALSTVLYPGLKRHPGHDVAVRQMIGGFGGMLSIRLKEGERAAIAAAARVKVWKRATSLGGVESLIEHRASIEGPGTPCPADLLRLSVGLEDPDDLCLDLERALYAG